MQRSDALVAALAGLTALPEHLCVQGRINRTKEHINLPMGR